MIRRFLAYSLAHNRPVRVLWADTMKCQNIRVIALEEEQVSFLSARRKTPETQPLSAILSASYARGDDGDTLKYAALEETKHD
ncbi:MAG: hypothetical protein IJD39_00770 [Clostridia bacterium]|nr:hypothetical protein [Clostridia bacterium]